jgi:aspartyl-tRNA(Asn)/glutamyl-tRNA(Gln) amidotransferase subunit C
VKITENEVRYVADLANLELREDEIGRMCAELDEILTHIGKLNELPTDGIEPMAQVLYEAEETATLREDVPHLTLSQDDAVVNAPQSSGGYFKVPKVIER